MNYDVLALTKRLFCGILNCFIVPISCYKRSLQLASLRLKAQCGIILFPSLPSTCHFGQALRGGGPQMRTIMIWVLAGFLTGCFDEHTTPTVVQQPPCYVGGTIINTNEQNCRWLRNAYINHLHRRAIQMKEDLLHEEEIPKVEFRKEDEREGYNENLLMWERVNRRLDAAAQKKGYRFFRAGDGESPEMWYPPLPPPPN